MLCGPPERYWPMPLIEGGWDRAIDQADKLYRAQRHSLVWNNCHSHVAQCMALAGSNAVALTPISIYWNVLWRGRAFG